MSGVGGLAIVGSPSPLHLLIRFPGQEEFDPVFKAILGESECNELELLPGNSLMLGLVPEGVLKGIGMGAIVVTIGENKEGSTAAPGQTNSQLRRHTFNERLAAATMFDTNSTAQPCRLERPDEFIDKNAINASSPFSLAKANEFGPNGHGSTPARWLRRR
ncbi:MAG TPA: hypothetical protein VHI52_18195 [Verrucomicrobiae bacterium]|nr:hypothetical protein [Verrucomicrobiae bacterium]